MTDKSNTSYFAFLLRIWCEDEKHGWRATLEDPQTGDRQGFANLDSLFSFLQNLAGTQCSEEGSNE